MLKSNPSKQRKLGLKSSTPKTLKTKSLRKQSKRLFSTETATSTSTPSPSSSPAASIALTKIPAIKKDGKIDINAVEDLFRAHRLAGLGDKYHHMSQAFGLIRAEGGLTPAMEEDLQRVFDVTSLKTADAEEVTKAKTRALINHYQRRPGDTGSTEVQVVILTEKINTINFHLSRHPHDFQIQRDFQRIINRRRKLLKYLKRERFRTYQIVCRDLNIDEHIHEIVGKLPKTKPYYDPTKPIYRRPLTEEQRKEAAANALLEKQKAIEQAEEEKQKAIKDTIAERRKQANMVDI